MQIAIITPHKHNYGGVETFNQLIKSVLEKNSFSVDFITLDDAKCVASNFILDKIVGPPHITSKLFKQAKKSYDLILCNGEFSFGVQHPKAINVFHGTAYGCRHYLSPYLNLRQNLVLLKDSYLQKLGSKNKWAIAVSDFVANLMRKQGIKTYQVIENCIDTELFTPNGQPRQEKILFVGSYDYHRKGIDILEKISQRGIEIDCVTNRNIGGNLGWIKNIANNKMADIYNQYKILIFPSRFEGCALVPLEAMSCGLPVIMTTVGDGEKLKNYIPEFVLESGADQADKYIERIKIINKEYDYYSHKARQYILEHHSFVDFEEKWLSLIKKIISHEKNTSHRY